MADRERLIAVVRRAQARDEEAFAELVRLYQDHAVAYAAALLNDHDVAQDIAQEALVDAYRLLPSLREPAAFPAWLRTIVFKHCDRLTRQPAVRVTRLDAAHTISAPEPSPIESLERTRRRRRVRDAIARLGPADRQVVLLYYMGAHSQAAIAEFLGITPNTVKTRLYAARHRLREYMSDIEKDLGAERPSNDARFADAVRQLIRPAELQRSEPLFWHPALIGTDLWDLFVASAAGNIDTVKALLERQPHLARGEYQGRSALSFAVRYNHPAIAALLVEHGADPFMSGTDDPLPLMAHDRGHADVAAVLEHAIAGTAGVRGQGTDIADAIKRRAITAVRRLLDASPDRVHALDERTNQPIHWAVMTRQIDLIDELLARGADINARRGNGARPIHLANGDYDYRGWRDVPDNVTTTPADVYRHLVARGAHVDLWMASFTGDIARVRQLLDDDPALVNRLSDYRSYYIGCGSAIKNAAAGGHIDIVRLLLERGADPNLPEPGIAPRGHALYSAVSHGHYEIAQLLLDHGAYPNVEVESSADTLSIARMRGDRRMIDLLCSHGAARAIHLLAHSNDLETAAAVFAANPDRANDTLALVNAADQGHIGFVDLMLRYRPELPKQISTGTPRLEITERLFAHGMDPNRRQWPNVTPLHGFAANGDIENARAFIAHGANIEAIDEEFCTTPLGHAARRGQALMVAFLLRHGARVRPAGVPEWAMPLAWATRRGHTHIVDILTRFERDGTLPSPPEPAQFDELVTHLLNAYNNGDVTALGRVAEYFPLPRAGLVQLRRHVSLRLALPQREHTNISPEQAREMIERLTG